MKIREIGCLHERRGLKYDYATQMLVVEERRRV